MFEFFTSSFSCHSVKDFLGILIRGWKVSLALWFSWNWLRLNKWKNYLVRFSSTVILGGRWSLKMGQEFQLLLAVQIPTFWVNQMPVKIENFFSVFEKYFCLLFWFLKSLKLNLRHTMSSSSFKKFNFAFFWIF